MDDKTWHLLMESIGEMKKDIKEIKEVNKEQTKMIGGIKVTVAGFASVFGVIGAYIQKKFF